MKTRQDRILKIIFVLAGGGPLWMLRHPYPSVTGILLVFGAQIAGTIACVQMVNFIDRKEAVARRKRWDQEQARVAEAELSA